MKRFKKPRIPLYIIAAFLLGLKTYIVYRFVFNIELDNSMQELILFINPFVSAFLILALGVWFNKSSRQMKYIRYATLAASLLIWANLVFYRQFTDFITIPQLFMGSNMTDLGSSILTLIKPWDLFIFADAAIIWYLSKKYEGSLAVQYPRSGKVGALAFSLVLLAGNFFLAEMERPQLFTRGFDREYLVKNIGLFNYHVYDVVVHSKNESQRVFADGNEIPEIQEFIEENIDHETSEKMKGVAKDKNIIFLNAESLQHFVMNSEVNGEEVTPFLNELAQDEDTYYFDNFYEQTGQGNTSDSEFLVENSLYPLSRGAVFFTHGNNEYHSFDEMIKEAGYTSNVLHANNKSFWNRDAMYNSLNIDNFFGEEAYDVTPEDSVGWGLKDKPFFEQSIPILEDLDEPFYSKMILLTNHFPFELDEEDATIDKFDSNSNTLNSYIPTVRYMDEAIEEFFDELKESGLYEDSIIVIMGDHIGISANHNKAMAQYLDQDEITPYDQVQLQRVPLFIHIPGDGNGKVMDEIAGQIDLKPTMLNMLGIDSGEDIYFGNDLFSDDRKDYVALRNGDFVSDDFVKTAGSCYDRGTGELMDQAVEEETDSEEEASEELEKVESACDSIQEKVDTELSYSDSIIYGDLFRFVDFGDEEE